MTGRLPDRPREVVEAFESLRNHLAGVEHIVAITTVGNPSGTRYRLTVIGEEGIDWDRVPKSWQGYEVEQLGNLPRRAE